LSLSTEIGQYFLSSNAGEGSPGLAFSTSFKFPLDRDHQVYPLTRGHYSHTATLSRLLAVYSWAPGITSPLQYASRGGFRPWVFLLATRVRQKESGGGFCSGGRVSSHWAASRQSAGIVPEVAFDFSSEGWMVCRIRPLISKLFSRRGSPRGNWYFMKTVRLCEALYGGPLKSNLPSRGFALTRWYLPLRFGLKAILLLSRGIQEGKAISFGSSGAHGRHKMSRVASGRDITNSSTSRQTSKMDLL
ncbi:HET-domain-containing protein, partial [Aureobasidium melanogenum]